MPPAITSWILNLPMPYLNPPLLIIYQVIPVVGVFLCLTRCFHLKIRFLCPSNYTLTAFISKKLFIQLGCLYLSVEFGSITSDFTRFIDKLLLKSAEKFQVRSLFSRIFLVVFVKRDFNVF